MSQTVATLHLPAKALPALPFSRVLPDDLQAHWAFVERGLRVALARCPGEPWTPDDMLGFLVDESAALYVRGDGFVILEQCVERVSKRKYLNVWVMWFQAGEGRKIRDVVVAWLDAMRAAHRCEWWQFSSPREGWVGIEPICKRYMTIWRRA